MRAFFVLLLLVPVGLVAQISSTPVAGLHDGSPRVHALVHGRVVAGPGRVFEDGVLVVRDGLVAAVGRFGEVAVPPGAVVEDASGRVVYPAFIELRSSVFLPEWMRVSKPMNEDEDVPSEAAEGGGDKDGAASALTGAKSWSGLVRPQVSAAEALTVDEAEAEELRGLGFGVALTAPGSGILRGRGALVGLGGGPANGCVLAADVTMEAGFETTGAASEEYPNSLMGCVALLRQSFADARWHVAALAAYAKARGALERPEENAALAALAPAAEGRMPVVFDVGDELGAERALAVAQEWGLSPWLAGSGYEYRVLPLLRGQKVKAPLVVPVNFPVAPGVETTESAMAVGLDALEHWKCAPSNPAWLSEAGIPFALTTRGLEDRKVFWERVRLAVRRGLSEEGALAALTTVPAGFVGFSDRLGSLEVGKMADFTVADGDLFTDEDARVLETWVDGRRHVTEAGRAPDLRGVWALVFSGLPEGGVAGARLSVEGGGEDGLKFTVDDVEADGSVRGGTGELVVSFPGRVLLPGEGAARLSGRLAGPEALEGTGRLPGAGGVFSWTGRRVEKRSPGGKVEKKGDADAEEKAAYDAAKEKFAAPVALPGAYPAGAHGRRGLPERPGCVLVRHATVWTCGPQGTVLDGDLLVRDGKVAEVGVGLPAPEGSLVVEAGGKHVTPGLVDCHSHTGIVRGVNEATRAVTVEVRVGDVLDPTDIAFYRELAGGVTVANVLHGSANPMGGQNAVVKLRWGVGEARGLLFEGARPGVKFALGENVKQANWGERYVTRYPQTRMGVPEIMRDAFGAARDYARALGDFDAGRRLMPVRRDLRLEGVLEILRGERVVHVHSYRQDEILAFVRLVQEEKFTVATFQHALEGYKVAREVASIGAGASCFSDWWGYKCEVADAVPDCGALMRGAGVLVSFNSDSNELARRLNTEAAKAVKYGGVEEAEALKFVTLNAAVQLGVGNRVGSLERGKDADFVLWSGSPLSSLSRCEETWIEGRRYFSLAADAEESRAAEAEKGVLVEEALPFRVKALADGAESEPAKKEAGPEGAEGRRHEAEHWSVEHRGLYHNGGEAHSCSVGGRH